MEKEQEKLIKAVNAELEEWLCSGDTDYLYKAMAVIRAEIDDIKGVDRMTIKELY